MTDSKPDQAPAAPTPEYEEARLALDVQARAWSAVARRWMWLAALVALAAVAVGVGVVVL